jgi:hypothetical protein
VQVQHHNLGASYPIVYFILIFSLHGAFQLKLLPRVEPASSLAEFFFGVKNQERCKLETDIRVRLDDQISVRP